MTRKQAALNWKVRQAKAEVPNKTVVMTCRSGGQGITESNINKYTQQHPMDGNCGLVFPHSHFNQTQVSQLHLSAVLAPLTPPTSPPLLVVVLGNTPGPSTGVQNSDSRLRLGSLAPVGPRGHCTSRTLEAPIGEMVQQRCGLLRVGIPLSLLPLPLPLAPLPSGRPLGGGRRCSLLGPSRALHIGNNKGTTRVTHN